jgi:hypothetical protein
MNIKGKRSGVGGAAVVLSTEPEYEPVINQREE